MKSLRSTGGAIALTLLSACGGGGGGSVLPVLNADPQGFWVGSTSDGRVVDTLVLPDGRYFSVYVSAGAAAGMYEGKMSVSGTNLSDPSSVDFVVGDGLIAASIAGTVSTKQTISMTASEPGRSTTITGTYNPVYDATPNLSEVVGNWSGGSTKLAIAGDGTFTGSDGACTFAGSATTMTTGKNVFEGTLTFTSSACPLAAGTTMPIDVVVYGGTQMVAVGVNDARTAALVFYGSKT